MNLYSVPQIVIEQENPIEIINTQLPHSSSVYYEDTTGTAYDVYVSGDRAYLADGSSGLAIIRVSDPTTPGPFVVYEDTTGNARDVYVSGDWAYVADGLSGMATIDVSDPTTPGTPYYAWTADYIYGIQVSGKTVFLAANESGLGFIEMHNPRNPGASTY